MRTGLVIHYSIASEVFDQSSPLQPTPQVPAYETLMGSFTPVSAAIGGALIGLSGPLLWLADGRIAGFSGVDGGIGSASRTDTAWRLAFITGLVVPRLL